jgi:hypothetical protein
MVIGVMLTSTINSYNYESLPYSPFGNLGLGLPLPLPSGSGQGSHTLGILAGRVGAGLGQVG